MARRRRPACYLDTKSWKLSFSAAPMRPPLQAPDSYTLREPPEPDSARLFALTSPATRPRRPGARAKQPDFPRRKSGGWCPNYGAHSSAAGEAQIGQCRGDGVLVQQVEDE